MSDIKEAPMPFSWVDVDCENSTTNHDGNKECACCRRTTKALLACEDEIRDLRSRLFMSTAIKLNALEAAYKKMEEKTRGDIDAALIRLKNEIEAKDATIKGLEKKIADFNGPECKNAECPDFDDNHPFHNNVVERFWNEKQKEYVHKSMWERANAELVRVTAELGTQNKWVEKLRDELDTARKIGNSCGCDKCDNMHIGFHDD